MKSRAGEFSCCEKPRASRRLDGDGIDLVLQDEHPVLELADRAPLPRGILAQAVDLAPELVDLGGLTSGTGRSERERNEEDDRQVGSRTHESFPGRYPG